MGNWFIWTKGSNLTDLSAHSSTPENTQVHDLRPLFLMFLKNYLSKIRVTRRGVELAVDSGRFKNQELVGLLQKVWQPVLPRPQRSSPYDHIVPGLPWEINLHMGRNIPRKIWHWMTAEVEQSSRQPQHWAISSQEQLLKNLILQFTNRSMTKLIF